MIEKEQFIANILKQSNNIQDLELADFFSQLGDKKEDLFSNFYDTLYSRKVSEISQPALSGILQVFLTSHDDAVNHWMIQQITAENSKTELFLSQLQDLRSSTYNLEFDGLPTPTIGILKTCTTTLFDLLTTKEGESDLAKKQLLSLAKNKLSAKYFSFVEPILNSMSVVDYDIKNNKIFVNVSNKIHRFILWSIRNQIAPFQIINSLETKEETLIKKLNQDITSFSKLHKIDDMELIEIVDINYDSQKIFLKTPSFIQQDILLKLQMFLKERLTLGSQINNVGDHTNTQNEENIELSLEEKIQQSIVLAEQAMLSEINNSLPENSSLADFTMQIIEPDMYMSFMQNYFAKFAFEAKINTIDIPYKFIDFMFKDGTILFVVPNQQIFNQLDDTLLGNASFLSLIGPFFGAKSIKYRIDSRFFSLLPKPAEKKVIELPKSKNENFALSPLALKVDPNKTFKNFQALSADKVQRILYTTQSRKNIAICGDTGTGKTHFAQALANHFGTDSVVGYTTGASFLRHYQKSVADYQQPTDKVNPSFKKSTSYKDFIELFQGLDYLIIEDIDAIEGTKVGTQNVLKTIVNQNPNMGLIVTSKKNLKDLVWQQKVSTQDGATGEVNANISTELRLTPILLEKLGDNNLKTIIVQQWATFCEQKKFHKPLPVGVVNFLADRVNSSHYDQIFESIYLNTDDDFSCDRIFGVIQNFVSEGLKPTPDQIIHIVIESFLKHSDAWKPYLNFENMGIDIDIFLDKYNETTLRNKIGTSVKADSLEGIILRLCVFYIKDAYPKKKFNEIGLYLNNRKDCSKLCDEATSWLISAKASRGQQSLDQFMKGEIKSFLLDTYGIKEQQLSLF